MWDKDDKQEREGEGLGGRIHLLIRSCGRKGPLREPRKGGLTFVVIRKPVPMGGAADQHVCILIYVQTPTIEIS